MPKLPSGQMPFRGHGANGRENPSRVWWKTKWGLHCQIVGAQTGTVPEAQYGIEKCGNWSGKCKEEEQEERRG